MLTGRQIRAARGLLEWTAEDLARKCDIARVTVTKIESDVVQPQERTMKSIEAVFDRYGVEFLDSEGVRIRKSEIRTFTGKAGYRQFLDHVYETMREKGGRICQFTSDGKYLPYADAYADEHLQRMGKLRNVDGRVIASEGDYNFAASYCEYRWASKELKAYVPFYVYNDHVVMSLHEAAHKREIVALQSRLLAERFVDQFDALWKLSSAPRKKAK